MTDPPGIDLLVDDFAAEQRVQHIANAVAALVSALLRAEREPAA